MGEEVIWTLMRPNPCKGWRKRPVEQIEKHRKSNGLMHVSVFVLMNLSAIRGGKKNWLLLKMPHHCLALKS